MIIFVSAGMLKPKKRDHQLARRQQFLNYGALSLASVLSSKGYAVRLVHGEHSDPKVFLEGLVRDFGLNADYPLLLSIPSFYALSWAQEFTQLVKGYNRKIRIVVGGRWVVGSDCEWLRERLPWVDEIVPGLAEDKIEGIVAGVKRIALFSWKVERSPLFNLDHRLVHGYKSYQPSVEASRGCGMGCAFCEERDIPLTPLKAPELLASHFQQIADQYEDSSIRPYVQSSFFAPNSKWADGLADAVSRAGVALSWRCESRVDSISPQAVASLAAAGLKVIDLGLESASEAQILRMKKTSRPDRYLRSASDLIMACRENGIWVKLNFLIYAGETHQTFDQTILWLDGHANAIKGISVGPAVVFGSPNSAAEYIHDIQAEGARLVDPESQFSTGIGHIHPSSEISARDAEALSLAASRRYMTASDYFDLKAFSYYPRDYSWKNFNDDVKLCDTGSLPFSFSSPS